MTEEEWFALGDRDVCRLVGMLTPRRQRLLAVAACRLLLPWIDYPEVTISIEVMEKFAETGKTKVAMKRARQSIQAIRNLLLNPRRQQSSVGDGVGLALFTVQLAASENAFAGTILQAIEALAHVASIPAHAARSQLYQPFMDIAWAHASAFSLLSQALRSAAELPSFGQTMQVVIRDLGLQREQRTSTVIQVAMHIYNTRDFSAMPILADALQDAGCINDDILDHCRQNSDHVRGCWVLDHVLLKS